MALGIQPSTKHAKVSSVLNISLVYSLLNVICGQISSVCWQIQPAQLNNQSILWCYPRHFSFLSRVFRCLKQFLDSNLFMECLKNSSKISMTCTQYSTLIFRIQRHFTFFNPFFPVLPWPLQLNDNTSVILVMWYYTLINYLCKN